MAPVESHDLLCAWAYIRHRRSGAWSTYGLCLLAFVGALLSKTQTVTLPASVLLADWALQRLGRIRRTRFVNVVARLLPMLVLGAVAGWITMRFEQEPWTRTFAMTERLLVITNAAAFYARTFFAPFWLSPIYPEWHVAAFDVQWWTGPIVCAVGVGALVLWRRRIPDLVLWGIAHFYIALIPVIGLFSFNFQTYALVADHFLYLSVFGGGLAVAIAAERASVVWRPPSRQPVIAAAGLLLLIGCSVQTYRECRHWQNNLAFWTRVRDQDPNGFVANYNLGNHYRYTGQWSQAVPFYRRAAEIRPRAEYPFQHSTRSSRHLVGIRRIIAAFQALFRGPRWAPSPAPARRASARRLRPPARRRRPRHAPAPRRPRHRSAGHRRPPRRRRRAPPSSACSSSTTRMTTA